MKKFLLLSALAISAMSVNAESFGDHFKLLYEGKEVTNGQELVITECVDNTEFGEGYAYECNLDIVNMKDEPAKMFGAMEWTGTPTYEDVVDGMKNNYPYTWGMPMFCAEQCFAFSQISAGEGYFDVVASSLGLNQFWTIHLNTIASKETVSKYKLFFAACDENGDRIEDAELELSLVIGGDNGSGVESISVSDEAPVYYDLQGRKVVNPEKGIYLVKRGAKVAKELVR